MFTKNYWKMSPSKRCGYGNCEQYDKHNKISGCKVYINRNECTKSITRRTKVAKLSQQKQTENGH